MSIYHEGLLLFKNETSVNKNLGFNDICKEKYVFVAYNNEPDVFEVSNITGKMVEYPVWPVVGYYYMAWDWEIQAAFFKYNNITPHWFNCNYTWGTLNYTTGQATGAVGMIQRDEADYAMPQFAGTYPRSEVAAFSPGIVYLPYSWFTRYPLELPPTWNLLGLFTKAIIYITQDYKLFDFFSQQRVWMFIFCSILIVVVSLIIMSRIYEKMYPEMRLVSTELVLIPFRSNFYVDFKFSDLIFLVLKFLMSLKD